MNWRYLVVIFLIVFAVAFTLDVWSTIIFLEAGLTESNDFARDGFVDWGFWQTILIMLGMRLLLIGGFIAATWKWYGLGGLVPSVFLAGSHFYGFIWNTWLV